jgi:hypothetical protein
LDEIETLSQRLRAGEKQIAETNLALASLQERLQNYHKASEAKLASLVQKEKAERLQFTQQAGIKLQVCGVIIFVNVMYASVIDRRIASALKKQNSAQLQRKRVQPR